MYKLGKYVRFNNIPYSHVKMICDLCFSSLCSTQVTTKCTHFIGTSCYRWRCIHSSSLEQSVYALESDETNQLLLPQSARCTAQEEKQFLTFVGSCRWKSRMESDSLPSLSPSQHFSSPPPSLAKNRLLRELIAGIHHLGRKSFRGCLQKWRDFVVNVSLRLKIVWRTELCRWNKGSLRK